MRVPLPTYRTFESTTTMEADSESSTNGGAIVSSDDDDSTSSSKVGSRPGRKDEGDKERSTKRRHVTTPPAGVPARTPPAPAAPTAARTVRQIIVENLRSDDETTLVKALKDLWSVHLDTDRDDLDLKTAVKDFIYCGGHLAVSWIMEKHPDCKEIQMHGMDVFLGAASLVDSTNIAKQLGNTRALHGVYAAMQRFPEDERIIIFGFRALMNLTCECESNCKILVEELDALPFLVERMESLASTAAVAQLCCGMLHNISEFPQMRRRNDQSQGSPRQGP
jgi:hypothetical protein